jgi:hypothetical protein
MTTKVRVGIAAAVLAAVAGLVYVSGTSQAGEGKELQASIKQIADAIKGGDAAKAKSLAAATAKKIGDYDDLMQMFRPRNKGGLGFGSKAGTNPAKDGIEVRLRDLGRDVPAGFAKEADNGVDAGYWIAAVAEIAIAKGWPKESAKKTKKEWTRWSEDMRDAGIAFAKASGAKGAQEVKTAATKTNNACNGCHSIFKE